MQGSVEEPKVLAADNPTGDQPAEEAPASKGESIPAAGKILEVGQSNFEQEVMQADTPVVVEFWAVWCLPCHMIRPTLEQLAKEFAGKLKFVSIDVDTNSELANKFSANYLPTIVVIEDGKETQRFVGALSPKQLYEKITKVLPSDE